MANFIHFEENDDEYAADVLVSEIVMLVDKKDQGTKVVLRSGYEFVVSERTAHLKHRVERAIQ